MNLPLLAVKQHETEDQEVNIYFDEVNVYNVNKGSKKGMLCTITRRNTTQYKKQTPYTNSYTLPQHARRRHTTQHNRHTMQYNNTV